MAELVQAGQGPLPRPLRGRAGDDSPRARRPPDRRAADRVLALDARSRGGDPADGARARDRLRRLQPARPRLPDRRASARSTTSPSDDFRRRSPRFQGENLAANLELVAVVEELAAREGRHARAARARVGALARRRHRPDPGHEAPLLPRGERGRGGDRAHAGRARAARAAFPAGAAAGDRYPDMSPSTDSERERLARKRRQHLRRHPERRRHVASVVAVAPVRAAHPLEVAEGRRARACAGREQGLDRPGRRLGVGAASVRQLEASVRF